ncbi:MAG: hypothetical protein LBG96_13180 [Tannerella sp.]|jgi:hypothetical protein|nr:hypothetical protein [Tannerella sp.]
MKLFYLILLLWLGDPHTPPSDCEKFAEKYIKPLSIDGYVKRKTEDPNYYHIDIAGQGRILTLKIMKNKIGKELYSFIGDSTLIVKKQDELYIRVIDFHSNRINVRHFETLCE